jgi:hypothetical protein
MQRFPAGMVAASFAMALVLVASSLAPRSSEASRWKGFRVLLVASSIPEQEVLRALDAGGIKDTLSESREAVRVSDWRGLETMPLSEAEARIVPGDPRLDGYLQRIGLWFEARSGGQAYRVFYLRVSPLDPGLAFARSIERALSPFEGRWILPDARAEGSSSGGAPLQSGLAAMLVLAAAMLGPILGSGRPRGPILDKAAFRLALVLPWLALAVGSPGASTMAALWAIAIAEAGDSLDLPLEEFRRRGLRASIESLRRQAPPPFSLPIVAVSFAIANASLLPAAVVSALGSCVAASSYALLTRKGSARHRFIPLPIGGYPSSPRRAASAAGKARAALACATIIAAGLGRLLPVATGPYLDPGLSLPWPAQVGGSLRPSISEARARAQAEIGDTLPGLASYLVHMATQEALPYVRLGEPRPDPFAPARLPAPSPASPPMGMEFTEAWARETLSSVQPSSVEGMLLSQGAATVGRLSRGGGGEGRPLAPIECLLYILLLVPPLGRIFIGAPVPRGAAPGEQRQEA